MNAGLLAVASLLLLSGAASGPHDITRAGLPLLAGLTAIGAAAAAPWLVDRSRRRPPTVDDRRLGGIRGALHELAHPSWRVLGAFGYLGFDIAVLWATFSAVGHVPPTTGLVVAYLVGYLANVISLPGGVGVLDAGVVGALVLYGAHITQATAAVSSTTPSPSGSPASADSSATHSPAGGWRSPP